ncbi:hypothetical protein [Streptacidiphilus carbonis]|uniref:hypothetical protein n=1 Tax=Streptacidiphilus carbonis TaxID=105422 RepID=UPI0005A67F2B|nr:hypothetical protein [Streptacidiphilus carbonis]
MSVLLCVVIAPIGLLVILGMSWFEDHVLRPPTSPGEQVVLSQVVQGQVLPGPVLGPLQAPAPASSDSGSPTVELLRIVRTPQQLPPSKDNAA